MVLRRRVFPIISLSVLIVLLACFSLSSETEASDSGLKISQESIDMLSKTNRAMAEVVTAVKPAVVNIASTRILERKETASPFFNDPFFKRFFGEEFGPSDKPIKHKQVTAPHAENYDVKCSVYYVSEYNQDYKIMMKTFYKRADVRDTSPYMKNPIILSFVFTLK